MAKVAEINDVWTKHLDKIDHQIKSAVLVGREAVKLGCDSDLCAMIAGHIKDKRKEYMFYKNDYGL